MTASPTLAFLDLVPIAEGGNVAQALTHAADVARACEAAGYRRYWVAEHHGMAAVGSAATSVVLAHIGAATKHIRIGSGGIMLPNHAPLQIAEQFGTLDALFPGRIDLGLGRAPGSDGRVAAALRRTLNANPDNFINEVAELQALFAGDERFGFTAIPGAGANPELWILGSSLYGAHVAAALGLPYAFASHFAPALLDQALDAYRTHFRASAALNAPHVMVAANVIVGTTADEAEYLASSMFQVHVALRRGISNRQFPPPVAGFRASLAPGEAAMLNETQRVTAIGTADTVRDSLAALIARTSADELIISVPVFDAEARLRGIASASDAFAAATQLARKAPIGALIT